MIKTADLERSKKLKSLGWDQEGSAKYHSLMDSEDCDSADRSIGMNDGVHEDNYIAKPTAGEMIEWLLVEKFKLSINKYWVDVTKIYENDIQCKNFLLEQGLENALADACAWWMERNK